jgi:hypothetical protein
MQSNIGAITFLRLSNKFEHLSYIFGLKLSLRADARRRIGAQRIPGTGLLYLQLASL